MSYEALIYWVTRLDGVSGFLIFLTFVFSILTIAFGIAFGVKTECKNDGDTSEECLKSIQTYKKLTIWVFIGMCTVIFLNVMIPSKKDVVYMYVGAKTLRFVETDTSLNKLPGELSKTTLGSVELLDKYLQNVKKELDSTLLK